MFQTFDFTFYLCWRYVRHVCKEQEPEVAGHDWASFLTSPLWLSSTRWLREIQVPGGRNLGGVCKRLV
jgi:hypothetical protein